MTRHPSEKELAKIRPNEKFRRKAALIRNGKPILMTGEYKGRHIMLDFSELQVGNTIVFIERDCEGADRNIYKITSKPFVNDSKQYAVSVENTNKTVTKEVIKKLVEERLQYEKI